MDSPVTAAFTRSSASLMISLWMGLMVTFAPDLAGTASAIKRITFTRGRRRFFTAFNPLVF